MEEYKNFLRDKEHVGSQDGFVPDFMPDYLFDFQKSLIDWSLRGGRRAVFADCGMGKTIISLVWAQNIIDKYNKPILIMSPLSVSYQTLEEAEKFGIQAVKSMDGKFSSKDRIILTNYERLHYFNSNDFIGVVCDESSILKNFDGIRKKQITEFVKKVKYRLLCTATAAPNDYIELGTSSEALGHMGYMDMLGRFFKNDEDSLHPAFVGSQWRFRRHGEDDFWDWMVSWARACRKPSDLGFEDDKFILPKLIEKEHIIKSKIRQKGFFIVPSKGWAEQRKDIRESIQQRCEVAAEKLQDVDSGFAWCHLNDESKILSKLIKGAIEVTGSDCDDKREEIFKAYRNKEIRVLVSKPKIAAFGMNWQHCSNVTYFPTHSYEQYYQGIRRFWRFGQENEVTVNLIITDTLSELLHSMQRKRVACDIMFTKLVDKMNNSLFVDKIIKHEKEVDIASWVA